MLSRAAAATRRGLPDARRGRSGDAELDEPRRGRTAAAGVALSRVGSLEEAGAAADSGLGQVEFDAVGRVQVATKSVSVTGFLSLMVMTTSCSREFLPDVIKLGWQVCELPQSRLLPAY